jgi:hypothetical protein
VGAVNSFGDVPAAIRELVRVTSPGGRVVLVDEQAGPGPRGPAWRALFRVVTFYERDPRSPTDRLPPGLLDVRDEQLDRAFYCLSFTVPGGPG